jgi:hypothetical protein
MVGRYVCGNQQRLSAIRADGTLNAIDYLEVLDNDAPTGSPRQQTLLVYLVQDVPAAMDADNVRITGGVRISDVDIAWAFRADQVPAALLHPDEQTFFAGFAQPQRMLVVRTDKAGDFTPYTMHVVQSATNLVPPDNFDPILSQIQFTFKVDCPSDFDCAETVPDTVGLPPAPPIDYLARDYASLRQLMLDYLSTIAPDWADRNPADWGIAVVEALAYVSDYQHYYLDSVATEAYLGTARKRVSVRRHTRLLDYRLHEGCNARAWVTLTVDAGSAADGLPLAAGTPLITRIDAASGSLDMTVENIQDEVVVFETMHALTLYASLSEMMFYTWGDEKCCLPRGSVSATLVGTRTSHPLQAGDVLLFEEVRGATTGHPADAETTHRHIVRLAADPIERADPLTGTDVLDIRWHIDDALPFTLCLHEVEDSTGTLQPVALARGNVVLVDHGHTVVNEALLPGTIAQTRTYRPRLPQTDVTFRVRYEHETAVVQGAALATQQNPRDALPSVTLLDSESDPDDEWKPRYDLLDSGRFDRHFVVEMDERDSAHIRFGDGMLGQLPPGDATFTATYRVGGGVAGNVGAEAIAHVLTTQPGITNARNPLPAAGGHAPESIEQARLDAPQAFRTQKRAVTEADYETAARLHPQVQDAHALLRWTGSWHTMFVTIDRRGGYAVDADFADAIRTHLHAFRLTGHDLEIVAPLYIPLEIRLRVCVKDGYFRARVERRLLDVFTSGMRTNGQRGFFHPDNLTFGQTVYLSRVIAAAAAVHGVQFVEPLRFKRWGGVAANELEDARITFAPSEIGRLDNDINRPENGHISFEMEGGL